jgi:hypothetical protein
VRDNPVTLCFAAQDPETPMSKPCPTSTLEAHGRLAPTFALRVLPIATTLALTVALASAQDPQHVLFGDPDPASGVEASRRFVPPVTASYYHEDSMVTTDLRAWYVNHQFPNNSPIGGGSADVYALQARVALTSSLQFVAYKDGYVDFDSGAVEDTGWNDLGAGLKWAFLQDWNSNMHAALGLGYEFGIGDEEVLQGDEELRLWASFNKGFDRLHLGATVNGLFATGSEDALGDSDRLSWHLHADWYMSEMFSPVVEFNGYHTLSDGNNTPLPFSGVDVANLGGGEGEDVITGALGAELRVNPSLGVRAAYEAPLTDNEDLYGHRLTVSLVWSL